MKYFLNFLFQVIIFFVIDIIRTLQKSMPKIIFYLSLILNISLAFNNFSEQYLNLKAQVFEVGVTMANVGVEIYDVDIGSA